MINSNNNKVNVSIKSLFEYDNFNANDTPKMNNEKTKCHTVTRSHGHTECKKCK
jgi:hypothetical protein